MRRLVRLLHLSVALAATVFLVAIGATGSILAFEPEIRLWQQRDLWHVDPLGPPLTLAELSRRVATVYRDDDISRFDVSDEPDRSWRVAVAGRRVHVNPYTGEVIGVGSTAPDWLVRVAEVHTHLVNGPYAGAGGTIVRWSAAALLVLAVTGPYLWWPSKRFTVAWRASPRRRWLDVHAVTGVVAFPLFLVLGVTGIVSGSENALGRFLHGVIGSASTGWPRHTVVPLPSGPIGPDNALTIARGAVPGAMPFQVDIPGPDGTYSIRMRFPEDRTPAGRSWVDVDQYTGAIAFVANSRTAPVVQRALNLNRALHTGDVFGLPSKVAMSLASALTVVMAVSGLVTWWLRRRAAA